MGKLKNTRFMQYVSAVTATLAVVSSSMYISWSSPIVPKIASGESPLGTNITTAESSWIVSSVLLGTIPGSVLSGWTVEKFGRRGSLLMSGIPLLLPWFVVAFSNSVLLVCIARFIAGIAISVASSGVLVYNGEIAEKEIRGTLGATFNIAGLTGELIVFCIGPYVSYFSLTVGSSVVPLIFLICFYFMPESPYYLSKIGKEARAKKDLKRLLSKDTAEDDIDDQMHVIKRTIDEEMKSEASLWEFLSKKQYRKSLIISLALQSLQQLSGFAAIVSYMQTIIGHSKSTISPEISSIICGLVQFPAVFIAAAIVDRAGRKPLLIISSLGCALALTVEGVYFYLQDVVQADVSSLSWVPTAGILFYIIMRPVGLGTLPFVLMGELFSTNIKGRAIAVSTFYYSILGFIVAKAFEPVTKLWGMHVIFGCFAIVCVLGALFGYFVLPETKGKTFTEIREKLNRKHKIVAYSQVPKPV